MSIIHVFWAQGWENAPPKAKRNAEAWLEIGDVSFWDDQSARSEGLLHDLVTPDAPPAMRADIVLAAAQFKYGGLAVGADMEPLREDRIRHELEMIARPEMKGHGMVVYSTVGDQPYNGFSWFPGGHPWLNLITKAHKLVACSGKDYDRDIGALTGPRLWRSLIPQHPGTWLMRVRTLHAARVFSHENEHTAKDNRPWAWLDPGLNGDWYGEKTEAWK